MFQQKVQTEHLTISLLFFKYTSGLFRIPHEFKVSALSALENDHVETGNVISSSTLNNLNDNAIWYTFHLDFL